MGGSSISGWPEGDDAALRSEPVNESGRARSRPPASGLPAPAGSALALNDGSARLISLASGSTGSPVRKKRSRLEVSLVALRACKADGGGVVDRIPSKAPPSHHGR